MKLKQNILLFYATNFFEACIFLIPIWYFFFVNYLNFGIGNAIMINTFAGLVTLLFEIHSGGWADIKHIKTALTFLAQKKELI